MQRSATCAIRDGYLIEVGQTTMTAGPLDLYKYLLRGAIHHDDLFQVRHVDVDFRARFVQLESLRLSARLVFLWQAPIGGGRDHGNGAGLLIVAATHVYALAF